MDDGGALSSGEYAIEVLSITPISTFVVPVSAAVQSVGSSPTPVPTVAFEPAVSLSAYTQKISRS